MPFPACWNLNSMYFQGHQSIWEWRRVPGDSGWICREWVTDRPVDEFCGKLWSSEFYSQQLQKSGNWQRSGSEEREGQDRPRPEKGSEWVICGWKQRRICAQWSGDIEKLGKFCLRNLFSKSSLFCPVELFWSPFKRFDHQVNGVFDFYCALFEQKTSL